MPQPTIDAHESENDVEKEARKRVAELKSFYSHLFTYLLVNAVLIGIFLIAGGDHFWPIYPIMGWGIGLVSHAASTFGMFSKYDRSWEERKVRELILRKEHGLNAAQVRELLKKEFAEERTRLPSADGLRRIDQRLQNLEAIVTSRDWDELPSHSDELRPKIDADPADVEVNENVADEAARLAKRVR